MGVEFRQVTVFFSDIADFTTISEELGVEKLSRQLSSYFEGLTKTILLNHGAVDKFIGDAVMAFWGAPKPLESHDMHACRSALECQRFLDAFAIQCAANGFPVMHTRIGLNSGDAMVGNMGFDERLSYTAIGDVVNLASRLEGLNKYYGTRIIINHNTYDLAKDHFEARPIDIVVVKGGIKSLVIYELLGEKGSLSRETKSMLDQYSEGMACYLRRDWTKAQHLFVDLAAKFPEDKPSQILRDRCTQYLTAPPIDDWNGAIDLRDK